MGWGGRFGVPGATCPPSRTQLPRAGAEGEGARSGAARAADKGSDRSPRPSPSPSPPATSAVTAYLGTAGRRGPRRARPSLCPPPPRRDPWAPAPHAPRLGPGAARVLRRVRCPPGPGRRACPGGAAAAASATGATASRPGPPPRQSPACLPRPPRPLPRGAPPPPCPSLGARKGGGGAKVEIIAPIPQGGACSTRPPPGCPASHVARHPH